MRWSSVVEDYGKELREGSAESPATDVFTYSEEGEKRWKDLKNRVVEHVSLAPLVTRFSVRTVCSTWRRSNACYCSVNTSLLNVLEWLQCCGDAAVFSPVAEALTERDPAVSLSTEHQNHGQVLHQNHDEEDGWTSGPLHRCKFVFVDVFYIFGHLKTKWFKSTVASKSIIVCLTVTRQICISGIVLVTNTKVSCECGSDVLSAAIAVHTCSPGVRGVSVQPGGEQDHLR